MRIDHIMRFSIYRMLASFEEQGCRDHPSSKSANTARTFSADRTADYSQARRRPRTSRRRSVSLLAYSAPVHDLLLAHRNKSHRDSRTIKINYDNKGSSKQPIKAVIFNRLS
jgi:hypothetical protein